MTTTLPYRARVYCNLGHLIGGSFADSYLQQAGLVYCRGQIELAGLYQPSIGAPVEFAYTRSAGNTGTASRLPRRLLVLASFADPLRNVTTVQIGCRLSLMRNKRETVVRATPAASYLATTSTELKPGVTDYVSPPISAAYVASRCLVETGITPAGALPLVNNYTVDEIDYSEGYVDLLERLLRSELYVGWMNDADEFETFSLRDSPTTLGPVINDTNCFQLLPNGPGELPAEQVIVVYDPVPLRVSRVVVPPLDPVTGEPVNPIDPYEPDDPFGPILPPTPGLFTFSGRLGNKAGWTRSVTYGAPVNYRIEYTTEGEGRAAYEDDYIPVQSTVSRFSESLLISSITTTTKPYAAAAGKYSSQALSNGIGVTLDLVESTAETSNSYDRNGRRTKSVVTNYVSLAEFAGRLDLTYVFSNTDAVLIPPSGKVIADQTVASFQYNETSEKREVARYVNWALSLNGQQAVSQGRDAFTTSAPVAEFVNAVTGSPAYEGTEVTISDAGPQAQRIPGPAELTRQVYGEEQEETPTVETDVELGAVESQTSIQFKLPFTPHDHFIEINEDEWEVVREKQRAQAIALDYGRVQNRILLGNIKGASVQLPAEIMPVKPFDPLYLQIGGLTGQYRANGMTYTFNRDGIVGQIDALFWLAIGQTGTPGPIWFPVPPAVTVLPAAPSTTVNGSPEAANSAALPGGWDAADPDLEALFTALPTGEAPVYPSTLNASVGLEPYNESVRVSVVTRSVLTVREFPYDIAPQVEEVAVITRSILVQPDPAVVDVPVTRFILGYQGSDDGADDRFWLFPVDPLTLGLF